MIVIRFPSGTLESAGGVVTGAGEEELGGSDIRERLFMRLRKRSRRKVPLEAKKKERLREAKER